MSGMRIVYTPRPDATPEAERSALASVYRFVLDHQGREKGGRGTAPDDATKGAKHDRATNITPDRT